MAVYTPAEIAKILNDHALWRRGKGGARADLYGADLYGADLTGADLTEVNFTGANLYCANLYGANLYGANLTEVNFTRANLTGANLTGANLTEADLYGANLYGADLTEADLTGADLTEANLTRADIHGAIGIRWGQVGPVGKGRRLLTAWSHESLPKPVIAGGCFLGTFAEFRETIAGEPWGWPGSDPADIARWRAECSAAADLLELAVS